MLYDAEKGDFTIALTGDCMLTRLGLFIKALDET